MTDLPVLDAVEQRVLGCLLEKQVTVPATYPLTLNALRTACNQASNRDPVMELDDRTVETTARALRDRGLLRIVWADTGRRVLKYHQTLVEVLGVSDDERALLTVLLLRGPRAAGELKSRTERLYPFATRDDVEACLHRLADREHPLVHRLERRPGQHDHRWVHLLGPVPETTAAPAAAPEVDRESPLADGAAARDDRVRAAYGAIGPMLASPGAPALVTAARVAGLGVPGALIEVSAIAARSTHRAPPAAWSTRAAIATNVPANRTNPASGAAEPWRSLINHDKAESTTSAATTPSACQR